VARNQEKLNKVRDSLPGFGHVTFSADLQKPEECVSDIFQKACEDGGKLTGFVHAAGIGPVVPIKMITFKEMLEIFTVNYFSFMLMVRQFIKKKHSDGGSIVAISSVAAMAGWQGVAPYAGSKGALSASIRAMAIELAPTFRLNSVLPSNIETDMFYQTVGIDEGAIANKIISQQPLGLGSPMDVASMVAFLLSSSSKFVTGAALPVDGGFLSK
jgi:NAD(P)-dependent dehydrogenase (short-subunit alcohol dehydrogenase family)